MAETTEPAFGLSTAEPERTETPAPAPKKRPRIEPRTQRGLLIAAGVLLLVLGFIHPGRAWMERMHIPIHYGEDITCAIKGIVAFGAMGLAVYELVRRLRKAPIDGRVTKVTGGVLAVLSVFLFFSSDEMAPGRYHHDWEQFHYYLGAKYAKELGYKRIYVCSAIAQSEMGPAMYEEAKRRVIRDLETDHLQEAAPVLEDPDACKSHFSDERWVSFKKDLSFFRNDSSAGYWSDMNKDHGYNPPPVWSMTGHFVASLVTPTPATTAFLASFDLALFVGMFFALWWAFGWRVLVVALIFLGAQTPANGVFTGGAFLRQDWLFFLVLSVSFARKRMFALSGGAIAWSALLRIFPAVFAAGWLVVMVAHRIRTKRFAKEHVRMFAGAVAMTVVLTGASVVVVGASAYPGFVQHIQLHNQAPLTNNMGLGQMLSYSESGRSEVTKNPQAVDPFANWAAGINDHGRQRKPYFYVISAAILALFVYVTSKIRSVWMAQCIGVVLATTLVTLTCYYYTFFLLVAPLARKSIKMELGLLFVGGMSAWLILWPRLSNYWDVRYIWQSALFYGFSIFVLLAFFREPVWKAVKKVTG